MASLPPKIVLGCGKFGKKQGWLNVDIDPKVNPDQIVDLEKPWPWPDNSFDAAEAHMIIEHIQNIIPFMNELWRVCKPKALVHVVVPDQSSPLAVADPTHKRVFNTESFKYFCSNGEHYWIHESYGITCDFILLGQVVVGRGYTELNVKLQVNKK